MNYKVFEVVQLENDNLATILGKSDNTYKVEEIDKNGEIKGIKEITDYDIKALKYSR